MARLQTIALDTNIFIIALDEENPKNKYARALLEKIKVNQTRVFISVIVLEEFFVKVYKTKQQKNIDYNLEFISLNGLCTILDVNRQIALLAASLRAEYLSLRAPDAIHLATAIASGAKVFITTDRRIPKNVKGLKVIVLSKTN